MTELKPGDLVRRKYGGRDYSRVYRLDGISPNGETAYIVNELGGVTDIAVWSLAHADEPQEIEQHAQNADGVPHLTYFVHERQASFCWTGEPDQLVEVSYGGYGEPVTERFRVYDGLVSVRGFKTICDNYLKGKTT